jgi:hypothetical protein
MRLIVYEERNPEMIEEMNINFNNSNNNNNNNNNNNSNSKIMLIVLKRASDHLILKILLTEKVMNMFSDWNGEIDVSDHV